MLPDVWFTTNRNGAVGDMARETGPLSVAKMLFGFTGNNTVAYRDGKIAVARVDVQQHYVIAGKVGYIKEVAGSMRLQRHRIGSTGKFGVPKGASAPLDCTRNSKASLVPWPATYTNCLCPLAHPLKKPATQSLKTLFRRKRP